MRLGLSKDRGRFSDANRNHAREEGGRTPWGRWDAGSWGWSFFFGTGEVALSYAESRPLSPIQGTLIGGPGADQGQGAGLTWVDLERIAKEHFVAVGGPPGATPEDLVRVIIASPDLSSHIRGPFVALAKAKAPHLLYEIGGAPTAAHFKKP